jgi:hypothetical protein
MWLLAAAVSGLALASCARTVTQEPPFDTTEEFLAALEQAGGEVQPTEMLAVPTFGVPGTVWQVGQALVQVYEFPTAAEREAEARRVSPNASTVGGQVVAWTAPPTLWGSGRLIVVYQGTDGGTILLLSGVLGDPFVGASAAPGGPYPPAVAAAIAAFARARGVDPGAVEVVGYDAVTWPDACLGLPAPGEACAAVTTAGYLVRLRVAGSEGEVHTDEAGAAARVR